MPTIVLDIGVFRGVVTALLLFAFCGMLIWAWSGRRKPYFDQAARLPLEDDAQPGEVRHDDE